VIILNDRSAHHDLRLSSKLDLRMPSSRLNRSQSRAIGQTYRRLYNRPRQVRASASRSWHRLSYRTTRCPTGILIVVRLPQRSPNLEKSFLVAFIVGEFSKKESPHSPSALRGTSGQRAVCRPWVANIASASRSMPKATQPVCMMEPDLLRRFHAMPK
jgi:hypothetical protein